MFQITILFDLQEAKLIPDNEDKQNLGITGSKTFTNIAMKAAQYRAFVSAKSVGMTPADREDLQQDLLVDMVAHADKYDAGKASLGTFAALVAKNHASDYLRSYKKDRARLRFSSGLTARDEPEAANDVASLFDAAESVWSDAPDYYAECDTYRDLQTAIAYMSDDQKSLFDLLEESGDLPTACKAYGTSPATFYRRVNDLQMHLRMFGLKAA
jgi:RNA polymerase sigma factor (sigma-70 family)